MTHHLVAVLGGDGIGPEVTELAARALVEAAALHGTSIGLEQGLIGGCAIDQTGSPLPPETLALCRRASAVLLGAVGGPQWPPEANVRPEQGLLALRRELGLFANLRPVTVLPSVIPASPIRPELVRDVDLLVVRELTGGIYFGPKRREGDRAEDVCSYTVGEIERVVRAAAGFARGRRKKLTSVDKANVLETSRLWREVATRVVEDEFPDVRLEHQLVDSCAMQLVRAPRSFDVVVTENLFGDVLTDEAAVLGGSIGMLPSASLGDGPRGLYEPIHGSAPALAGRGVANPYGAILSAAMMLRYSLGLPGAAWALEAAVGAAVEEGVLTEDVAGPGRPPATTRDAGNAVLRALRRVVPSRSRPELRLEERW
ncbi:MAG TPA: 3-isopropylmalate dehydrogenase [Myxococcaceae bacterium]|nr:3-isopropylmalate dehydrogenase [Myxococcaceae bacterium]